MRIGQRIASAIAVAGLVCVASVPAQATLIGNTIDASGAPFISPGSATIGAGVEFTGFFGGLDWNFGADTLTITTPLGASGCCGFGNIGFTGFDSVLTDVSLFSNSGGVTGSFLTAFSFTASSLTFNFLDFTFPAGSGVVFNIVTAAAPVGVPEPASLLILGAGLAALRFARRNPRRV